MNTTIPLIISVVAVIAGLVILVKETRADKHDERWVEFNHHPFVGNGTNACIIWSTDMTEQCGLPPEDHVYNREDAPHEW